MSITVEIDMSNSLYALFYDWYFYKETQDSIMLIGPAVLLLWNNLVPPPPKALGLNSIGTVNE